MECKIGPSSNGTAISQGDDCIYSSNRYMTKKPDSLSTFLNSFNSKENKWDSAIDRPVKDEFGDYIIHRLGPQQYLNYLKMQKIEAKGEHSDTYSSSDSDDDDELKVTTKDFIEILRKCDMYEIGRVFQQMLKLNLMLPIYFRHEQENIEEWYFQTLAFRYITTEIDGRSIYLQQNIDLPRVIFVAAGNGPQTDSLMSKIFDSVCESTMINFGGGFSSVKLAIKSISEAFLDTLGLPIVKREELEKERKNWMVFSINGDDLFKKVNDPIKKIFTSSIDYVFAENNSGQEPNLNWLPTKDNIIYWQTDSNSSNRDKEIKIISGDIDKVSKKVMKKLSDVSKKLKLERNRMPLYDEKLLLKKKNSLSVLALEIKNYLEANLPKNGKTYREQFKLTSLYTRKHQLERSIRFARDGTDTSAMERELGKIEKSLKVASKSNSCPIVVNALLMILKKKTRSERLMGCQELSKFLKDIDDEILKKDIVEVNKIERREMDGDWLRELSAAKSALNEKRTSLVHIWRELGYLFEDSNSNNKRTYENVPELAAQFLCDGGTIEMVDGETCKPKTLWLEKIFNHTTLLLKKKLGGRTAEVIAKLKITYLYIPVRPY